MNKKNSLFKGKFLLIILTITAISFMLPANAQTRSKININREWKFTLGDITGAEATSYDDAAWSNAHLPHSFSLPYFMWSQFYVGYGWYRKTIDYDVAWTGKKVFLEFEGSFIETEVFLNGSKVGTHVGGFNGFYFDITPFLAPGENKLAIRVNNIWKPNVAPRAGEHQFTGGIYRDMYLLVTDPLHVDYLGTFVTTPKSSATVGQVNVKTEIVNDADTDKNCTVKTEILSPSGTLIATLSTTQQIPAGKKFIFDQTSEEFSNPQRWSPETPYRYTALTTVLEGETVVDNYRTKFGIRNFEWTVNSGFFCNEKRTFLQGTNVHQDRAGWGNATTNAGFVRDVKMMKDAGFNTIRGSHYPHDPAFVEACDSIGLFYMSEVPVWGMGGFRQNFTGARTTWGMIQPGAYPIVSEDQEPFNLSALHQLKSMIRSHRNSPSINSWSMCNEAFYTDAATIPPLQKLLSRMVDSTHVWDPSRKAAIGGAHNASVEKLGDLAFYNGAGFGFNNNKNPGIPNIVSEYSSVGNSDRPGTYGPQYADYYIFGGRNQGALDSWIGGEIYWCGFDHGSIGGLGMAKMGMVDYFRIPKNPYYWYRNALKGIPAPPATATGTPTRLRLTASNNTIKTDNGTDDTQLNVSVINNANRIVNSNPDVTLTIESGPGEFPTGRSITFNKDSDIRIMDGQAAIDFRSYYAGTSVIKATSPGLADANITITTLGEHPYIEGVTPLVEDRPYERYIETIVSTPNTDLNLGTSRPAGTSSNSVGKANSVNDSNTSTIWKPTTEDTEKWWKLDMESTYSVNRVQIIFPTAENYRYIIEVSKDNEEWLKVIDQSVNTSKEQQRMAVGNLGENVRYLRVRFVGNLAGLAEVSVGGDVNLSFDPQLLSGTIIGTPGSYQNGLDVVKEAAMDWSNDSFFDGPISNAWVGLDLGYNNESIITGIKYVPRAGYEQRMNGGVFSGYASTDHSLSKANTLYTVSSNPPSADTTVDIRNPGAFRYLKYQSPEQDGWGNVSEIQFFGRKINTGFVSTSITRATRVYKLENKQAILVEISGNNTDKKEITLLSKDGKMLASYSTSDNHYRIPVSPFMRDVYLVRIISEEINETHKVVL